MKYAITVIDDSPESILGRSDDKTEIVIRRRTVVDFEVVQLASKDAEIAALKETLAKREHLLDEWNEKLTSLREQVERLSAPVSELKRSAWFDDFRPFINAIGEISVQEAMDAIERDLK